MRKKHVFRKAQRSQWLEDMTERFFKYCGITVWSGNKEAEVNQSSQICFMRADLLWIAGISGNNLGHWASRPCWAISADAQ